MKTALVTISLMASMSSFAATEFSGKMLNVTCKITGTQVTRTQTFGKEKKSSFTEKKSISLENFDFVAKAAAESSTGNPSYDPDFTYAVTYEGKTYPVNADDSKESLTIVQVINKLCR